jgi:phosphatidylglycerophosphatase A
VSLARQVATLGGIGLIRPAPGTWGSLIVLPAALLGSLPCLLLGLAMAVAGLVAVRAILAGAGEQDPEWIVIDEAAGMLIALGLIPAGAGWGAVGLAFVLFRAFDILKPWPVSWADGLPGAVGVMLDDVLAGLLGGAVLLLGAALWSGGL